MNRKNTETRKIEWLEVIPIAIIVISTMVVGWWMLNKEYNDYKEYHSSMRKIRNEIQQIGREAREQAEKELKEWKMERRWKSGSPHTNERIR